MYTLLAHTIREREFIILLFPILPLKIINLELTDLYTGEITKTGSTFVAWIRENPKNLIKPDTLMLSTLRTTLYSYTCQHICRYTVQRFYRVMNLVRYI